MIAHGRATRIRVAGTATTRWLAAERLPLWQALFDTLRPDPPLALPPVLTERAWRRDEALREVVRGRMEAAGPVSSATLSRQIGVTGGDIETALLALETEGAVLRGEFTGSGGEEWCERRLLARIHRYTISRLRREIEPLAFDDFVRFLFVWQSLPPLTAAGRGGAARGPEALLALVHQLAGYEAAAAAWEEWILPARLPDYDPAWLDLLCAGGEVAWARLRPPARAGAGSRTGPLSSSPIALAAREDMALWRGAAHGRAASDALQLTATAAAVHACLTRGGALFRDEIQRGANLLPSQVDGALAELAAAGVVTCDSFAGLRALIRPAQRGAGERRREARLRRAGASFAGARAGPRFGAGAGNGASTAPRRLHRSGRWSLLAEPDAPPDGMPDADVERVAMKLLERYGVVFRRLLERETLAPTWGELVAVCRRLEARGLIRGGYFVSCVGGEQFALAEAIASMRAVRRAPAKGELRVLSAVDPAASAGIEVHPSRQRQRIAAVRGNRILYRDGVPLAVREAGSVRFLDGAAADLSEEQRWQLERVLLVRDSVRARRLAKHLAAGVRQPAAESVSAQESVGLRQTPGLFGRDGPKAAPQGGGFGALKR